MTHFLTPILSDMLLPNMSSNLTIQGFKEVYYFTVVLSKHGILKACVSVQQSGN